MASNNQFTNRDGPSECLDQLKHANARDAEKNRNEAYVGCMFSKGKLARARPPRGQGLGWRDCGGGGVNVAQGLALWACSGHRLVLKQDAVRGQAASVDTRTVF